MLVGPAVVVGSAGSAAVEDVTRSSVEVEVVASSEGPTTDEVVVAASTSPFVHEASRTRNASMMILRISRAYLHIELADIGCLVAAARGE